MVHHVALPSSSASLGTFFAQLGTGVFLGIIEALDNSIRDDLQRGAHGFFVWGLTCTIIVGIGVLMEGPEILHELWPKLFTWFTWPSHERRDKFERAVKKIAFVGWFVIGVGVLGEGAFGLLQNRAEGQLATFNDILLTDARLTASSAKQSSVDAANAASSAREQSDAASVSSAKALNLARGARQEADSFKSDIRSATDEASAADRRLAAAQQQLADALEREAQAEEKVNRITTPRSLTNVPEMVAKLKLFKGTKYVFTGVAADQQSIIFLNEIEDLLKKSEWVRDKSVGGSPAILPDKIADPDFSIPESLREGVSISTEATDGIEHLQSLPVSLLPKYLLGAIQLRKLLSLNIVPKSDKSIAETIHVDKGSSETVKIEVGAKPLE